MRQLKLGILIATVLFSLSTTVFASSHTKFKSVDDGVWVEIPTFKQVEAQEYLKHVAQALEIYQSHKSRPTQTQLQLINKPSTAVIVGAGTIGLYALSFASDILPDGSTLILLQNDIKKTNLLSQQIKKYLPSIKNKKLIISQPIDLAELDKINTFLGKHKKQISKTLLYFHTADKADRIIPDGLSYEDVLPQIIRRTSVAAINDYIVSQLNATDSYVKVLVSSECAQNRNQYRIPNLGPYQLGKIVGDELFKSSKNTQNTFSFILYSGPMATLGQRQARINEFNMLKKLNIPTGYTNQEQYILAHYGKVDIHPMDSVGKMFSAVQRYLQSPEKQPGVIHTLYGDSVNPDLGFTPNKIYTLAPVQYLWQPLEE